MKDCRWVYIHLATMDTNSLFKLPFLALLYLLRSWNSNPPGSTPSESERKGYEKTGDTIPSFMLRWGRFMYKVRLLCDTSRGRERILASIGHDGHHTLDRRICRTQQALPRDNKREDPVHYCSKVPGFFSGAENNQHVLDWCLPSHHWDSVAIMVLQDVGSKLHLPSRHTEQTRVVYTRAVLGRTSPKLHRSHIVDGGPRLVQLGKRLVVGRMRT